MPNPYHFRARIDRLWRTANSSLPAYIQLKALDAVAREIYPTTDRARQNLRMYLTTDPYEVAQHKLRHLHDAAPAFPSPPAPGGGRCLVETEGGLPQDEQPPDEDDDPL